MHLVRNAAYRHNVAKEILSTERIFVKNLTILVKVPPLSLSLFLPSLPSAYLSISNRFLQVFLEPMRDAMNAGMRPPTSLLFYLFYFISFHLLFFVIFLLLSCRKASHKARTGERNFLGH